MKKTPSSTPKLRDVARLAGVGNATVSRVLNNRINVSQDKILRVTRAINELSYSPNRIARSLKGAASGMIGMIVPSISDMFFSQCAEAVEIVARGKGSLLIVMASHDDPLIEFENLQQLLLHRIDGLILSSAQTQNVKLHKELSELRLPVVGLDRPLEKADLPSVMSENLEGAKAATEHLLAHGYRKVLCMHVKPELYTIHQRLLGYIEAMKQAGLEPILELVENSHDAEACLTKHIGSANSTIAVFAANNLAARYSLGALRTLHLKVPSQVAVFCFDDFDLADTLTPTMSVVQQPIDNLGRNAAELLFQRMESLARGAPEMTSHPVRLPTSLIIRESCGCHPPTTPVQDWRHAILEIM